MKFLKWLAISSVSLVVLLAIAVGIISATVDPNQYKGQITQYVKDKQQRNLVIPGNLSLSFFPKIGVQVGELSLSEFKSDKVFVKLAGAKVSVELMPLLSRQVVVDRVQIDGLSAHVVKGKNGKFNFDDLAGGAAKPETKTEPRDAGQAQAFKLDIDSVKINNASISYQDESNGTQIAVSQLKLQTGRIADKTPTRFELSAKVEGSKPRLDIAVALKGDVALDLAGGHYQLDQFDLGVAGMSEGDKVNLSLRAPRLLISPTAASGEAISGAISVSGKQNLDAKFNLSGISGNAKTFAISSIKLDYNAKSADSSAIGTLSTALAGNLETQVFELKKIDANVKIDNPNIPAKTVTLPIQGSLRADLGKGHLSADIHAKFDESSIQAKVGMPRLAPPSYTFDIGIDKLNADRYRTAAPAAGGAAGPTSAEQPIDLSGLKGLSAQGSVRIGALQANNVKLSNVLLTLNAAGGKLQIAPLSAALYGGSLNAAASIDAHRNAYTFKYSLSNVQVNPLMKDAANQDIVEGKGHVTLDVSTSGTLPSALKKALNGGASVKLADGAIKGINIAERIRSAKSLLGAKKGAEGANKNEKTDFSEMSLSATIVNGVATSTDLNMASPLLRAKGAGQVNIGANTLDYQIRPKLVATSKGQEGKSYEQLSGIEMPVRIFGPLDAPQYQPDYAAAAMSAAQSELGAKLLDKVGGGKAGGLLGAITGKSAAPAAAPAPGAAAAPASAEEKKKPKDLIKGLFK